MTALAGSSEIGVDPAAPRPAIGFRLDVPDEFTCSTWTRRPRTRRSSGCWTSGSAAVPGAARHRVRARQVLQRMVSEHRAAGVFLAAFLARGGPSPGEMVGAGLTLAWRRFAGGIDLDGLTTFFRDDDPAPGEDPALREVRRVPLPYGEAVRVVNRQHAPLPLTSRRQEVVVVQHLVPAPPPAADWLAVLTLSTPDVAGQADFIGFAAPGRGDAGVPRRGRRGRCRRRGRRPGRSASSRPAERTVRLEVTTSTATARSASSYRREWWPQKSRSLPPARTTRVAARAPQRSQRSAAVRMATVSGIRVGVMSGSPLSNGRPSPTGSATLLPLTMHGHCSLGVTTRHQLHGHNAQKPEKLR